MSKLAPKAVIFDLGCTLIEYEVVPWEELNRLCAESAHAFLISRGYHIPDADQFHRDVEEAKAPFRAKAAEKHIEWSVPQVLEPLLRQYGVMTNDHVMDDVFDAYYQPVDRLVYAYPDVVETLQAVRSRVDVIGLISNTVFPERAHRRELERFGIAPFLDFALFSSTYGVRKPHTDIFRHAAAKAGVMPEECVYIGDRWLEDVVGPARVGMPGVLKVQPGRTYPPEAASHPYRIAHLSELRQYLEI